jgi:hypothetical protein
MKGTGEAVDSPVTTGLGEHLRPTGLEMLLSWFGSSLRRKIEHFIVSIMAAVAHLNC